MFVSGKIKGVASNTKEVLTIPSSAVLWTGERSLVYLKPDPNETVFEMREITLGSKMGENYQVVDGLENGDEIVTNGTFTVDAAAQLQGKKSMMNHKSDKNESKEAHFNLNERVTVSKDFQNQLKAVFNDYIQLKDALVKDDTNNSAEEAKKLLSHLSKVDMKLVKDKEAHEHWMVLEKEIKDSATSISNTSELADQRRSFKSLSTHLTNAIEVFGINEKVYHQYCPMVDNDSGAYWLSKEEKVLNPYFGDAMLRCGEVKQVIE